MYRLDKDLILAKTNAWLKQRVENRLNFLRNHPECEEWELKLAQYFQESTGNDISDMSVRIYTLDEQIERYIKCHGFWIVHLKTETDPVKLSYLTNVYNSSLERICFKFFDREKNEILKGAEKYSSIWIELLKLQKID